MRKRRGKPSNGDGLPSSDSHNELSTERRTERTSTGFQRLFVDVAAWAILIVWGIGFFVDMTDLVKDWDLPAGIWGLMMLLCGSAFAAQALKKD